MAKLLTCPDADQLKAIALGDLPHASAAELIGHVEHCSNCATRMNAIAAEDTLVEAVRTKETLENSNDQEAVSRLVQKVRALVSDAKSKGDQTVDGATPSSASAGDTGAFSFVDLPSLDEKEDDGLAPPLAPDEIGRLGPYRVLKVLGEGGMGKVFLAEDPNLQRSVALKVMKPSLAKNTTARQRFLREARLAAKIEHDNIVHIYQVGEDRHIPFLAMQLLKGTSLEDLLKRSGTLKVKQTLRIGIQIAEGLAAAHEQGMIHRDIKPGNIWIEPTGGGRVKILDFGLARTSQGEVGITQSGTVLGTPAYMPPEQARGEKVDHRCDLYSLGCVLYRMATGDLPLKGNDTMSMLMALALTEPTAPIKINPQIPTALSTLIMKLLAKDPQQRVGSAKEVVQALKAIERGAGSPAPSDTAVLSVSMLQPPAPPMAIPVEETKSVAPFAKLKSDPGKKKPPAEVRPAPAGQGMGGQGGRRRRPLVMVALAALFGVMLLGAGALVYQFAFRTSEGTLLVEVDKDADVRFKDGKLEIRDAKGVLLYTLAPSEKNKKLPPGDYLIDVVGADGLTLSTKEFSLSRNGEKSVRVSIAPPAVAQKGNVPDEGPGRAANVEASAYALAFDGQAWPVKLPTLPLSSDTSFTVEAWVRPDANVQNKQRWIAYLNDLVALRTNFTGYAWSFDVQGVSAVTPMKSVPTRLIHVAGVYNRKEVLLFVEGKLVDKKEAKNLPFKEAKQATLGNEWRGLIGEARISKSARYDKDFTPAKRFEPDKDTLALYHFDEGAGDVLKDSSGNNHHGKIVGARWVNADGTPIAPATQDFALDFDGERNIVNLPKLPLDSSKPYTLEAYITAKPGKDQNQMVFWSQSQTALDFIHGSNNMRFILYHAKGNTQVQLDVPLDRRIHVAAVRSPTMLQIFVDGKLAGSTEVRNLSVGKPPQIWRLGGGALNAFQGVIDEVRISKVARYTKDYTPAKRFEPDADTLALYHFDEGSGDVLKDSSGNNHHGKIVGAKWVKADGTLIAPPVQAVNYALRFEGGAKVDLPAPLSLTPASPFTLEAWVTPDSGAPQKQAKIIMVTNLTNLQTDSTGEVWSFQLRGGMVSTDMSKARLGSMRPVHLAGVSTGNELLLFVDGKLAVRKSTKNAPFKDLKKMVFGESWLGLIDEVRISKVARYTKEFTPAQRFENDGDTLALYHFDEGAGDKLTDSSGNAHHGKIVGAKWVKADGTPIGTFPPLDPAWLKKVAALPAEAQVKAVADELKKRNPGFDGQVMHVLDPAGKVKEVWFLTDSVKDISPVRALVGLKWVGCFGTPERKGILTDLSPLTGLPLISVDCSHTQVKNLAPLQGMKLERLLFTNTQVTDLRPLQGMPLKILHGDFDAERDSPILRSIPTLAVINEKAAKEFLKAGAIAAFPPLEPAWLKLVAALPAKEQVKAVADELQKRNPGFDGKVTPVIDKAGVVTDFHLYTDIVADITPVRALAGLKVIQFYGTDLSKGLLSDLSPLKDLKLTVLSVGNTQLSDLSPLKGMTPESLAFNGTQVSNLSPLKDMKLLTLMVHNTQVSDLSPLTQMKLLNFACQKTKVTDLSVLRGMPLKTLQCDTVVAKRHAELLRSIKTLETINGKAAAAFWKEVDDGVSAFPPLDPAWLKAVAAMKPPQQIEAVKAELKKRNPGFNGQMMHVLHNDGYPGFLSLKEAQVHDLAPLRALKKILVLDLDQTQVADLSPLKGMHIERLGILKTKVTDLSPLVKMPIEELGFEVDLGRDGAILRSIPTLKKINGKNAKEFLK